MSLNLTRTATPPPLEGSGLVSWAEESLVGKRGCRVPVSDESEGAPTCMCCHYRIKGYVRVSTSARFFVVQIVLLSFSRTELSSFSQNGWHSSPHQAHSPLCLYTQEIILQVRKLLDESQV